MSLVPLNFFPVVKLSLDVDHHILILMTHGGRN
jgi:hypothetical protein